MQRDMIILHQWELVPGPGKSMGKIWQDQGDSTGDVGTTKIKGDNKHKETGQINKFSFIVSFPYFSSVRFSFFLLFDFFTQISFFFCRSFSFLRPLLAMGIVDSLPCLSSFFFSRKNLKFRVLDDLLTSPQNGGRL